MLCDYRTEALKHLCDGLMELTFAGVAVKHFCKNRRELLIQRRQFKIPVQEGASIAHNVNQTKGLYKFVKGGSRRDRFVGAGSSSAWTNVLHLLKKPAAKQ
jgi:hypothetical protein